MQEYDLLMLGADKKNTGTVPDSKFSNESEREKGRVEADDGARCEGSVKKGGYRVQLYSEEDQRMYGKYLKKAPYDEALDEMFIKANVNEAESAEVWDELIASSITLDMQSVLPPSPSPEDGIIENECSRLLYRFIREETSKKVAQRIELFFYDEKSIDQIAESEGVSSQTVSESIANAIKRIRKRFRKAGYNVADI